MRPESIGLGQMEDHIFGRKMGDYFLSDYHPYNILKAVCLSAFLTVWSMTGLGKSIFDEMGGFYSIIKSPISGLVNNW